jgi:hypothetical protein
MSPAQVRDQITLLGADVLPTLKKRLSG